MQSKKRIQHLSELPTEPSTIGTMVWNQTGEWRYLTPVVADKMAPCSWNCPAGIPIPGYLNALKQGDVQNGLVLLLAHNPLPGLTGRLCYHPCQTKCARRKIDGAISIQQIERFLANLDTDVKIAQSGKINRRVAIIGSGPLGLSCAFYLGCLGCEVVVLDSNSRAGGALLDLSPEKMDQQVLAGEINRLIRLADIKLETGASISFDTLCKQLSEFDIVILDPTGLPEYSGTHAGAIAFNPFDDETITGDIITVDVVQNLKPFKASMIAHYIAAGRLTAKKLFDCRFMRLERQGIAQPDQGLPRKSVNMEDIKFKRFSAPDPSTKATTKQKETWTKVQALRESERCLSCGTCNLCLQCVLYCPDASIKQGEDNTAIVVDLGHCKGCGICAYECPRGVITMEEVET